jgi:hypothetical protein
LPDYASFHFIQLQGLGPRVKNLIHFHGSKQCCVAVKDKDAHLISFSVSSLFIMFLSSEVNMSEKLKIFTDILTSILEIEVYTQSKANMSKNRLFCLSKRDYF